jgi:UDP-N-acetylmuramoyl-tripeptide--D-alanyl-D-alanine ligase
VSGMRAEFVATPEEAGEWLARETRAGDVVLLKASRGVKLEQALERVVSAKSAVVGKTKANG